MKRKEICGSDSCADRNDISILIYLEPFWAECGICGICFMFHIRSLGFFLVVTCEKKLVILGSTGLNLQEACSPCWLKHKKHNDSLASYFVCIFKVYMKLFMDKSTTKYLVTS